MQFATLHQCKSARDIASLQLQHCIHASRHGTLHHCNSVTKLNFAETVHVCEGGASAVGSQKQKDLPRRFSEQMQTNIFTHPKPLQLNPWDICQRNKLKVFKQSSLFSDAHFLLTPNLKLVANCTLGTLKAAQMWALFL